MLHGLRLGSHPLRFFRSGIVSIQSALPSSDSALSALRPLGSTIVTRFPATMGRSDSRARFRSVIDSLAKLAPGSLPPVTGLPGSWLILGARAVRSDPGKSLICFCPLLGSGCWLRCIRPVGHFRLCVTRLVSVRFRYGSTLAPRSSGDRVAAAAVRVASCLMNNYMAHLMGFARSTRLFLAHRMENTRSNS